MKRIGFLLLVFIVATTLSISCAKKEEQPKETEEPAAKEEISEKKVKAEKEEIEELAIEKEYIHDFDAASKPNRRGGDFGSWDKDPSDLSQTCTESFDSSVKHGDSGFSLRLDYDVDSPNPAYNGFWSKLNNFDATEYDSLVIWAKGDADTGFTEIFKIELKSDPQSTSRYYITDVKDEWTKHVIPLDMFSGQVDISSLSELVIVFEDRTVSVKEGAIWIDDIYFAKK
jgi:hypothetical protein